MGTISNKMAKGAAWMVGFKFLERSIGIVSTIILARLLVPGDFGLVAMATSFLGLVTLLTSFSFDVALIQKQNADRHLYDTAWTFNVIFSLLLALILVCTAIPLAQFYNEARLEEILYVLALSTLLGGFGNIGTVAFRKDLQFHKEFYFLLAKKLMGFTVCIALAYTLHNYWALVWGSFAARILEILLSYRVHPYRPRFCLASTQELFSFSGWMFVINCISFLNNKVPEFIIGKLIGAHGLGEYNLSNEIALLPTNELLQPINRVTYPVYCKISDNQVLLANTFLKIQSLVFLIALPIGAGIIMTADLFVPILLGNKWLNTIPLIQVLAIYGVLMATQSNTSPIYLAKGKPRLQTFVSILHGIILLPAFYYMTTKYGVLGSAYAIVISLLFITPVSYWQVHHLLFLGFRSFMGYIWRPIIATITMTGALLWLKSEYDTFVWLKFITVVTAGISIYIPVVLFLWQLSGRKEGGESYIVNHINSRLFKKTSPS